MNSFNEDINVNKHSSNLRKIKWFKMKWILEKKKNINLHLEEKSAKVFE